MTGVPMTKHNVDDLNSAGSIFYRRALKKLQAAGIEFLVGGAYALECHTGIVRRTKDFDIFVRPCDAQPALEVLSRAGYQTEMAFSHWLGKAFHGDDFLDIIFSSGNGLCSVDEEWFQHAARGTVLGMKLSLCPAEETIWQKAYILERDRCDAADVAHLLLATAQRLDWDRLLRRFGEHWRVLYAHLVLFGFIYPAHAQKIPPQVIERLARKVRSAGKEANGDDASPLCGGTLISATQFLRDIDYDGYRDSRLEPIGRMTPQQIAEWTANFMAVK